MDIDERVAQLKAKAEAAQEVIERRGGFTADEVFRQMGELDRAGEDWSTRRVRDPGFGQSLDLGTYEKAKAEKERGPVTLEGLAAVIGALAPLYGHDTHIAECVDSLALKARELACGNPERQPTPCSNPECTRYAHGDDLPHIPGPHRATEAAVAKAEARHAQRVNEAKRLQDLTQGSTIRIWPHENPDRVLLMDCRPNSPWKGKTLFEPVTALVQEASYALSGGYLAALYDSRAKEAK